MLFIIKDIIFMLKDKIIRVKDKIKDTKDKIKGTKDKTLKSINVLNKGFYDVGIKLRLFLG